MIVWRIRGKIIRTVLCCIVYRDCTQLYAHSYEQFLFGLGLVSLCVCVCVCVCVFFLTGVSLFVLWLVILCFCVLFDCPERLVPKMACYVFSEALNSTHSLINFIPDYQSSRPYHKRIPASCLHKDCCMHMSLWFCVDNPKVR